MLILGMGGAIGLLLFRDSFSMGKDTIVGDLLVMVNASSYGLYLVPEHPSRVSLLLANESPLFAKRFCMFIDCSCRYLLSFSAS